MKKVNSSKRVSSLCLSLKAQLEALDRTPEKKDEPDIAEENRRVLFVSLKEKIAVLSK